MKIKTIDETLRIWFLENYGTDKVFKLLKKDKTLYRTIREAMLHYGRSLNDDVYIDHKTGELVSGYRELQLEINKIKENKLEI